MTFSIGLVLATRLVLCALFLPFSAIDKILNFKNAVGQAQEITSSRGVAVALISAGVVVEVVMSLGVITGVADRACACVLAGYCAVTALLWKRFWKPGDFWASSSGRGRRLFWDFLKNFALGAGFLLITLGSGASSVEEFFRHPLASSHPYQLAEDSIQP